MLCTKCVWSVEKNGAVITYTLKEECDTCHAARTVNEGLGSKFNSTLCPNCFYKKVAVYGEGYALIKPCKEHENGESK